MLAEAYLPHCKGKISFQEPVTYPDIGIWHPIAPKMFDNIGEYLQWYEGRFDIPYEQKDPLAPCIGLILARTHLVTGDDAHYVAAVQELEAKGARVIPVFAGGLDFSKPVENFFYHKGRVLVDAVVSLTGFALVGALPAKITPKP